MELCYRLQIVATHLGFDLGLELEPLISRASDGSRPAMEYEKANFSLEGREHHLTVGYKFCVTVLPRSVRSVRSVHNLAI